MSHFFFDFVIRKSMLFVIFFFFWHFSCLIDRLNLSGIEGFVFQQCLCNQTMCFTVIVDDIFCPILLAASYAPSEGGSTEDCSSCSVERREHEACLVAVDVEHVSVVRFFDRVHDECS